MPVVARLPMTIPGRISAALLPAPPFGAAPVGSVRLHFDEDPLSRQRFDHEAQILGEFICGLGRIYHLLKTNSVK